MNIREAKSLKAFDTFRRPSTNTQDHGFRTYTVETVSPEGFTAVDQHGYQVRCMWADVSTKPFLKTATAETMKIVTTPYGTIYRTGEREWMNGTLRQYEAAKAWENQTQAEWINDSDIATSDVAD